MIGQNIMGRNLPFLQEKTQLLQEDRSAWPKFSRMAKFNDRGTVVCTVSKNCVTLDKMITMVES